MQALSYLLVSVKNASYTKIFNVFALISPAEADHACEGVNVLSWQLWQPALCAIGLSKQMLWQPDRVSSIKCRSIRDLVAGASCDVNCKLFAL